MVIDRHRQKMINRLMEKGISSQNVLAAMGKIPRHYFIPAAIQFQAYDEKALPIGFSQTISHPYTVALMTETLDIKPGDKVLEIGTGSGYQTAILCELKARVFTIEIKQELIPKAKSVLNSLGYQYSIYNGDGSKGWPAYAPYDSIIVTAGAPVIPDQLLEQLNDPGKLIIPVGKKDKQQLILYKKKNNKINQVSLGNIKFVQLKGKGGWKE